MTDIFDRATEREEQMREAAIEEQQRRAHLGDPAQWESLSAKWCEGEGLRGAHSGCATQGAARRAAMRGLRRGRGAPAVRRALCLALVAVMLAGLWAWLDAIPPVPEWAAWMVLGVAAAAVLTTLFALCEEET